MRWIYLTVVWLHVLAAMTWVGGMVLFVVALMPFFRRQDEAVRQPSFAILATTGAFNLWMRGVQATDFLRPEWRSSSFGHLVLLKLGLVLLAVVISLLHERAAARWQARYDVQPFEPSQSHADRNPRGRSRGRRLRGGQPF